jgi:hypothetical protein
VITEPVHPWVRYCELARCSPDSAANAARLTISDSPKVWRTFAISWMLRRLRRQGGVQATWNEIAAAHDEWVAQQEEQTG